jgi:hypothetical protein
VARSRPPVVVLLGLCALFSPVGSTVLSLAAAEEGTATLEVRLVGSPPTELVLTAVDGSSSASVRPRDARATFLAMPPGTYRLVLEPGHVPVVGLLALEAGEVVRAALSVTASPEALAEVRLLERFRRRYGTVFDQEVLRDLPTSGDAASLLETVEPVAIADRRDTGGLFPGEPGRTSVHGASWTQSVVSMGGLDVTGPGRGGVGLVDAGLFALQALEAGTAALPAEVDGPGLALGLVPRRPASSWTGEAQVDGVLDGGSSRSMAPPIARFGSGQSWRLAAGGPLVRERLGLFVAGAWRQADRIEGDDPTEVSSERTWALAHLLWRQGGRNEARLLGVGQWMNGPVALSGSAVDGSRRLRSGHIQLAWTHRSLTGALVSAQGSLTRGNTSTPPFDQAPIERLVDGPVSEQPWPGEDHQGRTTLEGSMALPASPFAGMDHRVRFGLGVAGSFDDASPLLTVQLIPERLDGLPARLWERRRTGSTRWSASEWSGHLSDAASIGRLDVEAGLRIQALGSSRASGQEPIRWLDVAPRLFARLPLGSRLSLLGGYARYLQRLPLENLAWGDPAAAYSAVYRWNDRDGDGLFRPEERGPLVAFAGPGAPVAARDADLGRPRTDEFLLVLEAALGEHTVLRLAGIDREERELMESINVGLSPADFRTVFVPDPGGDLASADDDQLLPIRERLLSGFGRDRFLLTNAPGHNARHQGLELTLEARTARLAFLFGATAHRSDGNAANLGFRPEENEQGLVGELFDQPNADLFARGRLFSDRAYTLKIAASYRAPGRLRLGVVARYQDGQPFARLVVVPGLAQGADAVRAVPNGRHRFAYTLTVDGRVEANVRLAKGRLGALVECFNLLGTDHEVEEDVVTGPGFRTPTAIQPPRALRAGLRFEF